MDPPPSPGYKEAVCMLETFFLRATAHTDLVFLSVFVGSVPLVDIFQGVCAEPPSTVVLRSVLEGPQRGADLSAS